MGFFFTLHEKCNLILHSLAKESDNGHSEHNFEDRKYWSFDVELNHKYVVEAEEGVR